MSAAAAKIIKYLLSEMRTKEGRRRVGKLVIITSSISFLPILMIGYIFTSPLESLKLIFVDPGDYTLVESIHAAAPQNNPGGDFDGDFEYINGVVYFNQKDPRWKDIGYGTNDPSGTIGLAGCGPTAGAMVLSSLNNSVVTPPEVAQWCVDNGYRVIGNGTMHSFPIAMANAFGLRSYSISSSNAEALRLALSKGYLVMAVMGKGTFTNSGHFIVLCGLDENGRVYVADPNSVSRSQQTWELSLICNEAKANFIVIYPPPLISPSPS